jgi:hypothetical protein
MAAMIEFTMYLASPRPALPADVAALFCEFY